MIIYRDQRSRSDPRHLLSQLRSRADRLKGVVGSHEEAVEILLEMGTLETAITDVLFPEADGLDPIARNLRAASTASGHLLWHSWRKRPEPMLRSPKQTALVFSREFPNACAASR